MRSKTRITTILFLATFSLLVHGASRHLVAIKTKLTLTGSGRDQQNGIILIEDGIIKEVSPSLKIPWNAEVIDESKHIVMPGFVLAHTSRGLERANESMPDVPFLSTFDAIDPFQSFFRDSLRNGITGMLILPGNSTRFGGTGTVVKPTGKLVEDMLIQKPVGLKISMSPAGGQSRMGHVQQLRAYLDGAKKSLDKWNKQAKDPKTPKPGELSPALKTMDQLFKGTLKAFVYCPTASDVIRAIELIQQFKFKAILVLGENTWKAAPYIKKANLPVILPPDIMFFDRNPDTGEMKQVILPTIFAKMRIPFAFQCDPSSYDARTLWQVAAEAVKYGLPKNLALAAISSTPAGMIGLGGKTGQIRPGMEANLLVLTGDPLDPTTWIDKVLIGGKVVYDRKKDEYLKLLLKGSQK